MDQDAGGALRREVEERVEEPAEAPPAQVDIFRSIVETIPDPIACFDRRLRHLYVNPAISRSTGFGPKDYLGKTNRELGMPEGLCDLWDAALGCVFASGKAEFLEFDFPSPEGSILNFESRLFPGRDVAGRVDRVFCVTRDISERRRAEKALSAALAEKALLYQELEHRVKNSMAMIAGLIGLEAERFPEEAMQTAFGRLRDRVGAFAELYSALHEAGDLHRIGLGRYLGGLVRRLAEAQGQEGGRVEVLEDYGELELDAKRAVALGLVTNELLGNCFKHAFPGGRCGQVHITLRRQGEELVLEVADDGVGMPARPLEGAEGRGLGLVGLLAAQLEGRLEVLPGAGARLRLSFPRAG